MALPKVLITGDIDKAMLDSYIKGEVLFSYIPFVSTELIDDLLLTQYVKDSLYDDMPVIITSIQAVKWGVINIAIEQNERKVYCVGEKVANAVKIWQPNWLVCGVADNAVSLLPFFKNCHLQKALLLCGNMRLDIIPAEMKRLGIVLKEAKVYMTKLLPKNVDEAYNGVLFFSPSAVDSFFKVNRVDYDCTLFAIGGTTASAIRKYCTNNIVMADKPDKIKLLDLVVSYFRHNNGFNEN